jgi:hypothetical protein
VDRRWKMDGDWISDFVGHWLTVSTFVLQIGEGVSQHASAFSKIVSTPASQEH